VLEHEFPTVLEVRIGDVDERLAEVRERREQLLFDLLELAGLDLEPAGQPPAQAPLGERRSAAMLLLGILLGAAALALITTVVVIVQNT